MSKIFLADDDSVERELIKTNIKSNPRLSDLEIVILQTMDEVQEALSQPFVLFITLATYINKEKFNPTIKEGHLCILDHANQLDIKMGINISIFKTIVELNRFITIKNVLTNKEINQKIQERQQTIPHIKEKESLENTKIDEQQNKEEKSNLTDNKNKEESTISVPNSSPEEKNEQHLPKLDIEDEPNLSKPIIMENYPLNLLDSEEMIALEALTERGVDIRKAFSHAEWERNKTIGVWSSKHTIGVTTFIINFAIHLQKQKVPTAVFETPNDNQSLKNFLVRYEEEPKEWHSFREALHNSDIPAEKVKWVYKGVNWFPLGHQDYNFSWNEEILSIFFSNIKYFDFVLVDLPTGPMKAYTRDCLKHLDELWIMVDDDYHQILTWMSYIQFIVNEYQLKVKVLFNKEYPFSRPEDISNELGLPLLTTLPQLYEESHKNNYDNKLLIENFRAYSKLKPKFNLLAEGLLGKDYLKTYKNNIWFQNNILFQIKRMFPSKVDSK